MKDYEKYVLWLDYFNSELKRDEGRRVPLSSATRAPTLEELEEACGRLNLQPLPRKACYPESWPRESGYVSVRKSKPKQALVLGVAKELSFVRGHAKRKQPAASSTPKKRP
jgi:signal recognition particle subunit SEC65